MNDVIAFLIRATILVGIVVLADIGLHSLYEFDNIWYLDVPVMFSMFMALDFAYFLRDN